MAKLIVQRTTSHRLAVAAALRKGLYVLKIYTDGAEETHQIIIN